jgi:diphthamide synthase
MSRVDRSAPRTNVSPRRKGGSGGAGRRASSSADAEVFVSGQTIDARPGLSARLDDAAALAERPRAPFALSWSGGKDSALALWTLRRQLLEPEALITTVTESYERISMHGVRRELLARQAEALRVPLVEVLIPPSCVNEIYDARMAEAFAGAPLCEVEAVAFGDLFLEDVRADREGHLAEAGKRGLFPLWGRDTAALAQEFIDAASRRPSSASTRARSTRASAGATTTSGCSHNSRPASTPAARTASSTPLSMPARSSPRRSPASAARSSSATASSSATSPQREGVKDADLFASS